MSTQPEALRLADWIEWYDASTEVKNQAATELRRLHEVNEELMKAATKTIAENRHLADGDNCTLIHLVRAIAKATGQTGQTGQTGETK